MQFKLSNKNLIKSAGVILAALAMSACGGGTTSSGGGVIVLPPSGGGGVIVTPPAVVYGPYETVFGAPCAGSEPTPGCTFNRGTMTRVKVTQDPHFDRYGYDADDLSYVKFDFLGQGIVYDDLGNVTAVRDVSNFAGYVGGTSIGVGSTSLFWENVAGKTYWLGKNGVLYNANSFSSNFGEAINSDDADDALDTNLTAISSAKNKALIKKAAAKLQKDFKLPAAKATAVASALNRFAITAQERGTVSTSEINKTFKTVFGVDYKTAQAAAKDLANGQKSAMQAMNAQSAKALGLKPAQAQAFIKGMYKSSLAQWGVDIEAVNW